MQFEGVLYEKEEGVATITMNCAKVQNAFRSQTIAELIAVFEDSERVIFSGNNGIAQVRITSLPVTFTSYSVTSLRSAISTRRSERAVCSSNLEVLSCLRRCLRY